MKRSTLAVPAWRVGRDDDVAGGARSGARFGSGGSLGRGREGARAGGPLGPGEGGPAGGAVRASPRAAGPLSRSWGPPAAAARPAGRDRSRSARARERSPPRLARSAAVASAAAGSI